MTESQTATSSSTLVRPFYPALDGLRTLAFLMVFALHYVPLVWDAAFLKWGWAGVDLFFVISGFLITGILFDTLQANDYFRGFYVRRCLRILPLFYGLFLFLLLLTPLLHGQWNRYNLSMAVYIGNFYLPGFFNGLHASPGTFMLLLPHQSKLFR